MIQLDNATPIKLNREKSVTFGTLGTLALWLFTRPSPEMGELCFSVASMRKAILYIRQSTAYQLHLNKLSVENQNTQREAESLRRSFSFLLSLREGEQRSVAVPPHSPLLRQVVPSRFRFRRGLRHDGEQRQNTGDRNGM